MRTDRERRFKFTIEVEELDDGRWIARVDTDDAEEASFIGFNPTEVEEKAEVFCKGWTLKQPGTRQAYSYDYSPPVSDRKPA